MSNKFDKIIAEMKEEARGDLRFNKMITAQRDSLIKVGKVLIEIEKDVPEDVCINEHIRAAVISIGYALNDYNKALRDIKKELEE